MSKTLNAEKNNQNFSTNFGITTILQKQFETKQGLDAKKELSDPPQPGMHFNRIYIYT